MYHSNESLIVVLIMMYADTPNSIRFNGYLERKALWGQKEPNKGHHS